ncbi:hypothetical protein [Comamonas sp. GB3 AK4-5]|uniref:hypothetical protein n=1 Tax=Comamonas sp. GB3 AK4-5 TaxID=3231487 RepID=UPI00351E6345
MNKVLGFAPDSDPTTPGLLVDCENLIPSELGMRPGPTITPVGVAPLVQDVRGAMAAIDLNGNRLAIVGTQAGLFTLSGNSWGDISGAGAPFSLGNDERWALTQFANSTMASCRSAGMQMATGGHFVPLDAAPKAKILASLKGFVMAFNTQDSTYGDSPDRWWCSAYLNAADWTPSVATLCTTGRLVESGGEITAAHRLGDDIIVYKRRSTFVGRYTGPAEVWNFTQVDSDVGCVGQDAVCDTGKAHFFIGDDDIYSFDGVQVRPIGRGVLRDWFVQVRDPKSMHRSQAFWDKQNQLAWFFFPSVRGGGELDFGLVYHPSTNKWGRANNYIRALVRYASPAASYDGGSELVSDYDSGPSIDYDSPFWAESQELMSGFDAQNRLVTFSGVPGPSSFTSGDFGDEDQHTLCDRLVLRLKEAPASAWATGYTKDDGGQEARQASMAIRDDAAFDMRQRGRWHRFRVDMTGDYALIGLRPRLKQAGYR